MLTFRRALIAAAIFILIIYFITHTHRSSSHFPLDPTKNPSEVKISPDAIVFADERASKSEILLHDMPHVSLREKLAYQYPYDLDIRFPAYIWQTWKYTPASGSFKETFRPAEASWTEFHPSFVHEVITDQVAVHLLRHLYAGIPEVLEAYKGLPSPILKADFFRYLILFARGGIYSDIDTYALKSAVEWLPESVPRKAIGLVIGIESDPNREDWASLYPRPMLFCQWTIQSKPGHPVLREVIAKITENTLQMVKDGSMSKFDMNQVHELTGSTIWTDVIFNFFNDPRYFEMSTSKGNITWAELTGMKSPKKIGDIAILPITSFSPGINQMGAEDFDSPLAYVRHEFTKSWKDKSENPKVNTNL